MEEILAAIDVADLCPRVRSQERQHQVVIAEEEVVMAKDEVLMIEEEVLMTEEEILIAEEEVIMAKERGMRGIPRISGH